MDSIFTMYYILQTYCPFHLLSSSFYSVFFTYEPLLPYCDLFQSFEISSVCACPSSHTVTLQIILLTAAWTSVWRLYSKLLFRHILIEDNPGKKKSQVSFNLRTYQTRETIPCRSGLWLLPKKCGFLWRVSIVRRQKCWTSLERRLESEKMRIFK